MSGDGASVGAVFVRTVYSGRRIVRGLAGAEAFGFDYLAGLAGGDVYRCLDSATLLPLRNKLHQAS